MSSGSDTDPGSSGGFVAVVTDGKSPVLNMELGAEFVPFGVVVVIASLSYGGEGK